VSIVSGTRLLWKQIGEIEIELSRRTLAANVYSKSLQQ
jgi:hypothetical protein